MGEVYRDENEAAFSAVSRLREENAHLRTQVDDLQRRLTAVEVRSGLTPAAAPSPRRALMVASAGLMVFAMGVMGMMTTRSRCTMAAAAPMSLPPVAAEPVHMSPFVAPPPPLGAFDRAQAAAALAAVDVSDCRLPYGPTGSGHVSVVFDPDGTVSSATVDQPPFVGTAAGGCVARKFRGATLPAFIGNPVRVGKSFVIGASGPMPPAGLGF
jgi:hypothetical protein